MDEDYLDFVNFYRKLDYKRTVVNVQYIVYGKSIAAYERKLHTGMSIKGMETSITLFCKHV